MQVKDFTLKQRMLLGFGLTFSIILSTALLNNFLLKDIGGRVTTYVTQELPEAQALQSLATASYSMRMPVLVVARTPEPDVRQQLSKEIAEKRKIAEQAYADYQVAIATERGREILPEISAIWAEWIEVITEIYALSEAGEFDAAHRMQLEGCEPIFHAYEDVLSNHLEYYENFLAESNYSTLETLQSKSLFANTMSIVQVITLLVVGVLIYRGVSANQGGDSSHLLMNRPSI